ncbi:DNRLRE domain-containing protein (plasmid) [Priestia megaterium]|uniref:DNRLRE domain-containing protein n=1 Tax=Priestia megaterium TaxID=1404 RepID=UPI00204E4B15|nr:DNRLRE domain-containing protein [Priestia megaterium]UOO43825.1 DNRLRE domain-containing protein [Priestia megaterium]
MLIKSSIKGKLFKSIVWSIVFTLFITVLPILNAHAETKKENEEPIKNTQELEELPQLRTENSKTYLDNEKNQYIYEEYTEPIHYKQGNQWEDINNTIVNGKSESDDQDLSLENKSNRFKVKFSKKSKDNRTLRIKLKDQQLSFGIVGANKVQGVAKDNSMTYPGVFQDTDLNFQVDNNAVKEALILNKNIKRNKFTYEFKLKNLVAKKDNEGNIVFENKKGKTFYVLSKPFMYDSAEAISHDVSMEIREEKGKTYVDVTADEKWLNSSERKYPVVIDPTVDVQDGNTADTFISSTYPNSNYYTDPSLITGKQVYYGTTRSLVKFNLKNLLSGAKITSAKVTVSSHSNTSGFEKQANVSVYPITKSWSSNSVNWGNQPTTDAVISNQNVSTDGDYTFYTTNLVKDWYSGKKANYGIMLKNTDETADRKMFRSSDYSTDSLKKPKLTVVYSIDPIGEESYWTSGASPVNTYNGNYYSKETDIKISGRGLPITVERTYNSRDNVNSIFGSGWSSNLDQSLKFATDELILYRDSDGTNHIFTKDMNGKYVSPGGVYLQLEKNSDGTFKLINKDESYATFDKSGNITMETDTNGNKTAYSYTDSRLTSVTDASGRKISISYGTNGKISSITDPVNRVYKYTYDSNDNLIKFNKTDQSASTVKSSSYNYDSEHQMTSYTDAKGVTTKLSYNADKRLIKYEQPITVNGAIQTNYFTLTYDITNGVTVYTDAKGIKTQYTHNAYGNVTKIIYDLGGKNNTETYSYDEQNNLIQTTDANTNKSGSNASSNYTYDKSGNVINYKNALNEEEKTEYDESNNQIAYTDSKGNTSEEEYDNNNNNVASTDATAKTSAEKYDDKGNVIEDTNNVSIGNNLVLNGSFEVDSNKDNWPDNWAKLGSATFSYESNGAAIQNSQLGSKRVKISNPTTNAAVESNSIAYDPGKTYVASGYIQTKNATSTAKLVVTGKDANGAMTKTFSSGVLSGTSSVERFHLVINPGDLPDNTKSITLKGYTTTGTGDYFFDGLQIEEEYYGAYNLVSNSDFETLTNDTIPSNWYLPGTLSSNDGIDKTNSYSGKNSVKLTGQNGVDKFVRQEIDVNGKSGQEFTVSGFSKAESPNPSGGNYNLAVAINYTDGTTQWVNGDFNKNKSHDWQFVSLRFATTKDFKSLTLYYQYKDQAGTAWFDSAKVQLGSIRKKYAYDSIGNYVVNETDQNGNTVWKSYDPVGNVTGQTVGEDTRGFKYDANDNLVKVTDEDGKITSYTYDESGNQTSTTNANGKKTNFEYNENNKMTSLTDALGRKITYNYDILGNQTKVSMPNGNTLENEYDSVNLNTATLYNGAKRYEFTYDANGNKLSEKDSLKGSITNFLYDADNKIKEKSDSKGIKNTYAYDANGNVIKSTFSAGGNSIVANRTFNKNNQLTNISMGNSSTSFMYTENDEVSGIKNKNGTFTLKDYDGAGQLTRLLTNNVSGNLMESFEYTYDEKGNRITEKTKDGLIKYTYDKKDQLIKEIRSNGDIYEYTYDSVGNRITKKITKGSTVETNTYTYDDANQLTKVNNTAITHDKNGNLVSDGKNTHVYDAENRLVEVKNGATSIAKYNYNADGLRVSKTIGENTTYYTYDENNNVVLETDGAGKFLVSYTYDSENKPLSMIKDGKNYTFHFNGHDDVKTVTDEQGTIVASFDYDSWGNILKESGTLADSVPFRYAGYRYDKETNLYYLQQRYYNPDTGRFLTLDPLLGAKEIPTTQNGYSYGDNNPVMNVDPNGMFSVPKALKSTLKYFIKAIFNDFIENTLTNAVMIVSGGGLGAWTARKLALKGLNFNRTARYVKKKALIGFITGGISSYVSGNWFTSAAGKVQYILSKAWKYESWFDKTWLGKKIDNGLRKARNYLLRRI